MGERINVAELLKDCPKGMELDCTIYNGEVCFEGIDDNNPVYPIKISINKANIEHLDIWGQYSTRDYAKCVIFPKGKTTWKGFVPSCEFKDGDIVATMSGSWIGITVGGRENKFIATYCVIKSNGKFEAYFDDKEKWSFNRLATEKEKQKLFQAIKDNGYRWNFHAKRLEKLIIPNFKKGDKVRVKKGVSEHRIIDDVCDTFYTLVPIGSIDFADQDKWELVPNKFDITTLIPFESRVLVRDSTQGTWYPEFFGGLYDSNDYPYMVLGGNRWKYCVPYKGNEHLLKTNNDCDEYYKTWE
jgi:hypothetical protein